MTEEIKYNKDEKWVPYKQLAETPQQTIDRLEQENKELKDNNNHLQAIIDDGRAENKRFREENKELRDSKFKELDRALEAEDKYKSALEEIREIITNDNSMIIDKKIYFELQCGEPVALKLQKIYSKINEALQ